MAQNVINIYYYSYNLFEMNKRNFLYIAMLKQNIKIITHLKVILQINIFFYSKKCIKQYLFIKIKGYISINHNKIVMR